MESNAEFILKQLRESQKILDSFIQDDSNLKNILLAAEIMSDALSNGGKILSCGNGGSMSDAIHFAEELSGKYRENRPALAAISISDIGHISCVANDFGYQYVFSRFVEGLGQEGDILLAISTSGNSENVVLAAKKAIEKGIIVVALTGKDGGKLADCCSIEIRSPESKYADRVQEIHIKVIHILIGLIEKSMFKL